MKISMVFSIIKLHSYRIMCILVDGPYTSNEIEAYGLSVCRHPWEQSRVADKDTSYFPAMACFPAGTVGGVLDARGRLFLFSYNPGHQGHPNAHCSVFRAR